MFNFNSAAGPLRTLEEQRETAWLRGVSRPQSVSRTSFTLHTSMVRPSDTEPPSKAAATVTRHPFILGSLRVAFALGASGPAWLTAFASDSTVMDLAGSSDPFTTVTAVAACGLGGCGAARRSVTGVAGSPPGTAAAGGEAGAASTRVGFVVVSGTAGARTGVGVEAASSGVGSVAVANTAAGMAGGAVGM